MRLSLRVKLFLALLVSSLISHGVAGWLVLSRINAGADAEAREQAQTSAILARTMIAHGEHSFLQAAEVLAAAPWTADTIAGPVRVIAMPTTPPGEYPISTFFVSDRSGRVVAGFEGGKPIENRSMPFRGLQEALSGEPNWGIEPDEAGLALLGFAPVVSDGRTIGAVCVGGTLDRTFVNWAKMDTGYDYSILNPHGDTVATTLPDHQMPVLRSAESEPPRNRVVVGGQTLAVYARPLQNRAGQTLGYVAVWSRLGPLEQTRDVLMGPLVGVAVVVLCVDVLIAWVTSHALTRRIRQLTLAARRIAVGDYEHPANVGGADEIGDLGRAFEDMRQRIGEGDRLKSGFISTVSHELRTPIAHIKGYSQLLLADGQDEATRREYLQIIEQASDRLTHLVENMLDVSQIQAGLLELFREPVAIGPFVGRQVERQRALYPLRTFELDLAPDLPTVEADPERLQQVLRALLDNAVQYSAPPTVIAVRSYVAKAPPVVDPGGGDGPAVVVEVEDHGIGIAPADQTHMFEPFYRVECGLDRRNQGCGLDLTVCQGIIRAHGGRIWVRSTLGQGSTFGFSLPLSPRHGERTAAATAAA